MGEAQAKADAQTIQMTGSPLGAWTMTFKSASGWNIVTGSESFSRIGVSARGVVWFVSVFSTGESCSSADVIVEGGASMVGYQNTVH